MKINKFRGRGIDVSQQIQGSKSPPMTIKLLRKLGGLVYINSFSICRFRLPRDLYAQPTDW